MSWDQLSQVSSTVEQFTEAVDILGGGVWAYFKFFRGRSFSYRTQLSIDKLAVAPGAFPNVSVRVTLLNCGLSQVPFTQRLKVVKLYSATHSFMPSARAGERPAVGPTLASGTCPKLESRANAGG